MTTPDPEELYRILALARDDGAEYAVQHVDGKACAFVENLAPMTATPFFFVKGTPCADKMDVTTERFETPFFKGEFDSAMRITSLVDTRCDRQLAKDGEALNRIESWVAENPGQPIEVDVDKLCVRFGEASVPVTLPAAVRNALINGRWDPIADLLENAEKIKALAGKVA